MTKFVKARLEVMNLKSARNAVATAGAGVLMLAGQAHAALPAGVETALGDVKTDVTTLGGLVLVIVIAIAGFKLLRRGT
ncbi:MAG: major capsid protein [Burkholderiaceae bacterium]|nr:major capsid protein [Burkholderiaceae bacterium]